MGETASYGVKALQGSELLEKRISQIEEQYDGRTSAEHTPGIKISLINTLIDMLIMMLPSRNSIANCS